MLLYFKFRNFACFKDEVVLDMRATDVEDITESAIEECGEKAIPVAAIFGANASGKTRLLTAIMHTCSCVFESLIPFIQEDLTDDDMFISNLDSVFKRRNNRRLKTNPFLFDKETMGSNSFFELGFTLNGSVFSYSYEITPKGDVFSEVLIRDSETVFNRGVEVDKITFNNKYISAEFEKNIRISLDNKSFVLSVGGLLKIKLFLEVIRYIISFNIEIGTHLYNPSMYIEDEYEGNEKLLEKELLNYIKAFDQSICRINIIKVNDEDDYKPQYKIYTRHKVKDTKVTKRIPLEQESLGTRTMIDMFFWFKKTMNSGGLLLVDELTASLHPLIVRNIVQLFRDININKNHAQLIFTTHEVWLLNDNTIRTDGIWFTEKDENGVSSLYSLADFADISGEEVNFMDRYLQGRFGGIPNLTNLFSPQED
jgi:AAA15 family ATPase/GTPase